MYRKKLSPVLANRKGSSGLEPAEPTDRNTPKLGKNQNHHNEPAQDRKNRGCLHDTIFK